MLHPQSNTLTLSTLTFWGNRTNKTVHIGDIVPCSVKGDSSPVDLTLLRQPLVKMYLFTQEKPFLFNPRFAIIPDPPTFLSILLGNGFPREEQSGPVTSEEVEHANSVPPQGDLVEESHSSSSTPHAEGDRITVSPPPLTPSSLRMVNKEGKEWERETFF